MACFHPFVNNTNSRLLTPDNLGLEYTRTSSSALSNTLASSRGYIQNSAVLATHASLPSLPGDQFWNAATNHHDNGGPGTTRIGEQHLGTSRKDNGDRDWTTSTPRHRQKGGLIGGDISRSEGGKRKVLHDAPEKTRKIQKCSSSGYLEILQGEHFTAASTSTSDARYVGFGSPQEVIQAEAEDDSYLVPIHPLHHSSFLSDGLTGSPALTSPQENYEQLDQALAATQEDQQSLHENFALQFFDEYPRERFSDMFDIPCIPTWQPRRNLDHDLVFQQGHGESFALHQDRHDLAERFSTHFECLPERLAEICSI